MSGDNMATKQKGFSAVEVIIVLVIIGIIAALGWLYFSNMQTSEEKDAQSSNQDTKQPDTLGKCKDGSIAAENGTFCSTDVGLSVQVPEAFKGKLAKIDNYTVYTQNTIAEEPKAFGKSDTAYEATIKGTDDEYNLIIAKEPLRNFRVKSYVPALFNKNTKQIHYDSQFSDGREADSVVLDGVKFYNYGGGDAGFTNTIYAAVINDKIIVVSLTSNQKIGDPATTHYVQDVDTLFTQFKERIKSLKVV